MQGRGKNRVHHKKQKKKGHTFLAKDSEKGRECSMNRNMSWGVGARTACLQYRSGKTERGKQRRGYKSIFRRGVKRN